MLQHINVTCQIIIICEWAPVYWIMKKIYEYLHFFHKTSEQFHECNVLFSVSYTANDYIRALQGAIDMMGKKWLLPFCSADIYYSFHNKDEMKFIHVCLCEYVYLFQLWMLLIFIKQIHCVESNNAITIYWMQALFMLI